MGLKFGETFRTKGRFTDGEWDGYLVTPSDTVDLPNGPCQAICVTGAGGGAVAVNLDADSTAVMTVVAGAVNEIYPIMVSRVLATNTTATAIYALYKKS